MRVLHLEDSAADAELIAMTLRREWPGCTVKQVATEEAFGAALRDEPVDIILSDYSLPGFDGLTALAKARAQRPHTPFLFLSGTIGEERAVEALKRGATDYIIKDRPSRLVPAIRQALALVEETRRRQRSEETLRENETKLREQGSWLDKARDAIIATDLDLGITYWNASAERLYGLKPGEVVGRRLDELGLGFEPERLMSVRREVLAKGEWRGEFHLRTRTGSAVLVESTWSLMTDGDGQPSSILAIDTDVTERKKLEAQLQRAQRMESIGTLAGGVAHDLNNVLTPILFTIDLLGTNVGSAEDRRLVEETKACAVHGAALVRQLLAFGRGVEGQRGPLDLAVALAQLEPLLRQSLPPAVRFSIQHRDSPGMIEADPTQFNQVLVNLALNARDAMPSGGALEIATVRTTVDAALAAVNPGTRPGIFARISVSDTGSGIPPAVVDRIFDPFFTTKPAGKGSGLGLSMVASIMKTHGGFVQVESEPGRGTTFHLYFPALVPDLPPATPSVFATGGAGEGVLLVDDEPMVRDTLRLLLQRAGYQIFPAGDGSTALRQFQERQREIALVITDMMLPDRSGLDVVKQLRAVAPTLPIIAISGMMASGDYDELTQLDPPVECLSKPLPPRALLSAARRALHAIP